MARDESPPFPLGQTYYNGGTIDSNNLGGVNLEGKEWVHEDIYYGTNLNIRSRIVRNVAAAALKPGYLATYKTGFFGRRVDGLADTTAEYGYAVDAQLPAAGVPVNDLFHLIISGPTFLKTDLAAGANNVITEGDLLSALTAVTSGATTAGRVATQILSSATTAAANINATQFNNWIARAMSSATTANTNANILAYMVPK